MEPTVNEWNARTLPSRELERVKYDVIGLCEVRWTRSSELDGEKTIWSDGENREYGVGIVL
jgi:hypothetical protein